MFKQCCCCCKHTSSKSLSLLYVQIHFTSHTHTRTLVNYGQIISASINHSHGHCSNGQKLTSYHYSSSSSSSWVNLLEDKMPCYRKDDCAMRHIYKLLLLFTLTATILCTDLILKEFELRKFCLFLQEWRFSHSRSSEVDEFGANRQCVCDFLFRNSNLGPILHHFGDMTAFMCSWFHPYSTLILGVFPLHQIAHVGVNEHTRLKLFGREIIFEECQPMWSRYLIVTGGWTDGQTTCNLITAYCVASRGKKPKVTSFQMGSGWNWTDLRSSRGEAGKLWATQGYTNNNNNNNNDNNNNNNRHTMLSSKYHVELTGEAAEVKRESFKELVGCFNEACEEQMTHAGHVERRVTLSF